MFSRPCAVPDAFCVDIIRTKRVYHAMPRTYREIRSRARAAALESEAADLEDVFEYALWRQGYAASVLECSRSTLQRALTRHPDLEERLVDGRRKMHRGGRGGLT